VNTRDIVQRAAKELLEHRHKLSGKAADADHTRATLEEAAKAIVGHRDQHRTDAATATSHWNGDAATSFDRRAQRMTAALDTTATAATKGAQIVAAAAESVAGNRTAVNRLVEEYTTQAAGILDTALNAKGAGAQAALTKAVGKIRELIAQYTNESAKHLRAAQHDLRESAKQLKALEHGVEHDHIADPTKRHKKPAHDKHGDQDKHDKHGLAGKITKVAEGELGYHEGPGNSNKYGPAAAWCSSFASWVWRKSGVDIPITPFTGDMYHWGQQHGTAYDSHHLQQAKPGDVLLFGTGPQSPSTSTHIGIVESVHGNTVTLIEGNSSDSVRRVTHPLSSSIFYGGVHPR
jgi:peptidoglycan DL-endopeptidase CwlO